MRNILILLCLLSFGLTANSLFDGFGKVIETGKNITSGLISRVPDVFPSIKSLLDTKKQILAGYPFEIAAAAINELCSQVNALNGIQSSEQPIIDKMSFLLMTPCKNYSYPLKNANEMLKSPGFDPKRKTVILTTGWTTNINETGTIYAIGKAYLCRGDVNFIAVDAASFVDTLYTWSALNTEDIGNHLAIGLIELSKIVSEDNIHLIGHSLGAHIVGNAARTFNEKTKKLISRVTGLDPAKPCFKEGQTLSGLYRGDAQFVDVIHSNPGVLGRRDALGDVDFYPDGLDPLPSGCFSVVCAHARAWEYYAETVYPTNENNFMAVRCSSLTALNTNKCPGNKYPMGYAAPSNLKGNYFLAVNSNSPFGVDAKDQIQNEKCGLCNA